jgi:hypothetical protein
VRCFLSCFALLVFALSPFSFGKIKIDPTTSLVAETNNNTSAASSFKTQSNGNIGAGSVSKQDIHSLLYPGSRTKIYAHFMAWFGSSRHMNVGYSSTSASQVHRQIEDMLSRGIDGVIIDWYGPDNIEDVTSKLVMAEAEKHPGFVFAIMVDKGAIPRSGCSSCSAQQALVSELQYIAQTYFSSPAYMRWNGRPVVTNFDLDIHYTIDWNAVAAAAPGNPVFIFQHSGGFTHPLSSGSYSWVINSNDYGMSYLTNFYKAGLANSSKQAIGANYKGFNDTLASWGSNRIMGQQCGKTWLQTFAKINSYYNSSNPLDAIQLVTWNDYEEGTEIESGIDNCVSISASISGKTLSWKIDGDEATIDHYTVFISEDGNQLMPLTDVSTGNHSLNLDSYSLKGKYTLYVKAVGKPMLRNHTSEPVSYTASSSSISIGGSGPGGGAGSDISLALSASALTLDIGETGDLQVTVRPKSGSVNSAVALSCSDLPPGMSCFFLPGTVIPGNQPASARLMVSTVTTIARSQTDHLPIYAMWLPFGLAGVVFVDRKRIRRCLTTLLLAAVLLTLFSCGYDTRTAASGTYNLNVTATSSSMQSSAPLVVKVK